MLANTLTVENERQGSCTYTATDSVRWWANTFLAEWTENKFGEQVLADDALLRFIRFSCNFPVFAGETEEDAANRLLTKAWNEDFCGFIPFGSRYIAESTDTMIDFLPTVHAAVRDAGTSRIAAFDRIIWKAFELDGEEILCRYMEAALERQVSREELDEWWLNEMLHDMPGFLRAIQAEAAAVDPADNYQWWEYHR